MTYSAYIAEYNDLISVIFLLLCSKNCTRFAVTQASNLQASGNIAETAPDSR